MNDKYQPFKFMAATLVFLALLSFSSCVGPPKNSKGENLNAIQLISSFPVFTSKNQLVNTDDTLTLFYKGDVRLFQISYLSSSIKTTMDKEGNTVKEEIESIDLKNKYFFSKREIGTASCMIPSRHRQAINSWSIPLWL